MSDSHHESLVKKFGENEVKFAEKSEISQNHEFFIEISEATVRDFDSNPGACESSGLKLSHAQ